MKSLYLSVCLAVLTAMSLSLFAFRVISAHVEHTYFDVVFEAMDQLELETAMNDFEQSGQSALQRYLALLDRSFGPRHALLDAAGYDLLTGANMSALLPPPPAALSRGFVGRRFVVTHRSANGGYWLVSVGPEQTRVVGLSAYYYLAAGTAAFLGWLAAAFVVRPIGEVTAAVVQFGDGNLTARSVVTRRDEIGRLATSFNDMAERLERLLGSERQLLMDISHELRSPLTRLKLATKLARTSADPGLALDRIEREVDKIAALTAEIVEVTRLEGDPRLLRLEHVDLRGLVMNLVSDCCSEMGYGPSKVLFERAASLSVVCDGELMSRAIENVVRNALRFTPEEAQVHISVTSDAHGVNVTVRDFGPGVPSPQLALIFDPFFRVDKARNRGDGGVGLGLSIVKRIVLLHGGEVVASNTRPGLSVAIRFPDLDSTT